MLFLNKLFRCDCPVTSALDVVGDKWTLVIIKLMLLEYKKTFKRKKLLYSALGIPVTAGIGLILFMATFDLDFSGGAKLDGYQGS